jgi:hypothetical protein
MIHFGLKIIDEHGAKCSEWLRDLAGTRVFVEDSIDHMRSQWISFSIRKQEARLQTGVSSSQFYKGDPTFY